LIRLSQHLVRSRLPSSIPFPGSPAPYELDILAASEDSPFLSSADRTDLLNLRADLFRICQRARERRVKVIVDAEYRLVDSHAFHTQANPSTVGTRSVYSQSTSGKRLNFAQPAVDAYTTVLSEVFNNLSAADSLQPIVYGTYQAYLRRSVTYALSRLTFPYSGFFE
jgi:proline dehydrogenase